MKLLKLVFDKLKGKERYVTATFSKKIADQKMNDPNPLMPILEFDDLTQALSEIEKEYELVKKKK